MKDTILWDRESDRYTERARALHADLYGGDVEERDVQEIVDNLPIPKREIKSILDLGCGYGSLSATLAKTFPKARVVGVDPGKQSLAVARRSLKRVENLSFKLGYSHATKLVGPFDLIVLRMVLQWIPRTLLLSTVAEIDRLCGGFVFIQDFFPDTPASSVSVHNRDVRIFKQDYAGMFTAVPYYRTVYQRVIDAEHGDNFKRGNFLLRKIALDAAYVAKQSVQQKDKPR